MIPTSARTGLERLFEPVAIAVVGASARPGAIGGQVLSNLSRFFEGRIVAVNRRSATVLGHRAVPSITALAEPVDLAVIALPAADAVDALQDCVATGIGAAVVVSSGFTESGRHGRDLQERMEAIADEAGLALLGPNCIGFLNVAAGVAANFAMPAGADLPKPGNVAVVSQSGGLGSFLLARLRARGVPLGWFVSTGNEAGLSVASVVEHLAARPDVDVVLVFAEAVRDADVLRRAAVRAREQGKTIALMRAGRSDPGARAALSHTASVAGAVEAFDALCEQVGIVVAGSVEELLDIGSLLGGGKKPTGDRVGILTTSGGTGVVLADACAAAGLRVPSLGRDDQDRLLAVLPKPFFGAVTNPVDVTAQVGYGNGTFGQVLATVAGSPEVDAVVTTLVTHSAERAEAIVDIDRTSGKPVVVCAAVPIPELSAGGVPTFEDPAAAMRALAAVVHRHDPAAIPVPAPAVEERADLVARVRRILAGAGDGATLSEVASKKVLAAYGVPVVRERSVASVRDAVAAGDEIGWPVALKVVSQDLPHKSDFGGVRLGVTRGALASEYDRLLGDVARRAPAATVLGVVVQAMVPAGLELVCGARRDPVVGSVVTVGMGGTLVEVVRHVELVVSPFDRGDATRAVERIAGGRLVGHARGLSSGGVEAVVDVLQRVGRLMDDLPEIVEIDVNPLCLVSGGVVAADALVVRATAGATDQAVREQHDEPERGR